MPVAGSFQGGYCTGQPEFRSEPELRRSRRVTWEGRMVKAATRNAVDRPQNIATDPGRLQQPAETDHSEKIGNRQSPPHTNRGQTFGPEKTANLS